MSLDDRLSTAVAHEPDFDSDGDLADVRRRASRIRLRRAAVTSGVLVLVIGIAANLWPSPSDRATVDTANTTTPWFLPTSAPDGYRLAWIDLPPAARTGDAGRAADPPAARALAERAIDSGAALRLLERFAALSHEPLVA